MNWFKTLLTFFNKRVQMYSEQDIFDHTPFEYKKSPVLEKSKWGFYERNP